MARREEGSTDSAPWQQANRRERDSQTYKFPVSLQLLPSSFLSNPFLPRVSPYCPPPMARTSGNPLWKETPSTGMTKAQLLEIANAKEARIVYLFRKYSEYRVPNGLTTDH